MLQDLRHVEQQGKESFDLEREPMHLFFENLLTFMKVRLATFEDEVISYCPNFLDY